jgi:hypothetical protein
MCVSRSTWDVMSTVMARMFGNLAASFSTVVRVRHAIGDKYLHSIEWSRVDFT